VQRVFTLAEARATLADLRSELDEVVRLRADLVEAAESVRSDDGGVGLADLKGMEARLSELVDGFGARGIQIKGWAPLLLDFPTLHDGREILWCWLEGEDDIGWYHDAAHGFAGRRPLARLGLA
jgi:hypothetical protein